MSDRLAIEPNGSGMWRFVLVTDGARFPLVEFGPPDDFWIDALEHDPTVWRRVAELGSAYASLAMHMFAMDQRRSPLAA